MAKKQYRSVKRDSTFDHALQKVRELMAHEYECPLEQISISSAIDYAVRFYAGTVQPETETWMLLKGDEQDESA